MLSLRCVLAAVLSVVGSSAASAQQLVNLGFETQGIGGRPSGWGLGGDGFELVADSVSPMEGRFSLRTRWIGPAGYTEDSRKFAVANQPFPVAVAAGRRLRLSGYIRTEGITTGFAGFWMRVDAPNGAAPLAFDNMASRGPRGTTPWTRHVIELPVDSGAGAIYLGLLHPGDGTAWFDSITVEVFGEPMPRTVLSYTPPPRTAEDMSRLLTDAELAVPRDSVVISEDSAYAGWMRKNARPIRSLGATDFSDLQFFKPLLNGKRIVQLGESGHGVAEFSLAKVRLIKYLHEEMDFDVMAFESSTFECDRARKNVQSLSALELMRACIFGVWHADEVVPLFEYIKETQRTTRPLILAGFDEQTSSLTANARPGVLRSLVSTIDTAYARHVYTTDSVFLANRRPEYAAANKDRLVAFYDSLAAFITTHRRAIEAAHRDDPNAAMVGRQAATSMTYFVRQLAAGPNREGTEIRDLGMANNLDFLRDELYPGKKIIVWAHNFHIQHRENTRATAADSSMATARTMGTWVAERHRRELYTIGLFMYRGTAAANDRRPYQIARSRTGSFESILHQASWRYAYVDFSRARRERGTEWMWNRITGLSWGTQPEQFVPRDEYDGVLFIDTVHTPRYR
ncbi:erythromycin esterase family protein [Gemmatimonas groenlandica]|uniref:Erythromycin esterase family protein n=1 Tax=Gemmatimonas groenlandica TaxID=2732249 RepID=A0A6M4ISK2_9BACT|nr:erythromycin esterase family protein [Gemmatimonas groenlandica]QJR35211.1 erythromycin esterase family protein [Gemmatimonas groenlandica]